METSDFETIASKLKICEFCRIYFLKQFADTASVPECPPAPITKLNTEFKLAQYIPDPCPNCLGINQLVNNQTFLSYLHQSIIDSGFEFEGFNFNFRFPLSLKLRQRYFHMLLSEALKNANPESPMELYDFDVKLTIKHFLNVEIAARTKTSVIPNEDFVISLEFANVEDETEFVD